MPREFKRSVANLLPFERSYLTLGSNPYSPPRQSCEAASRCNLEPRFLFLLLPPLIPLAVHGVVRWFIPANEVLYHFGFAVGAILVAWIWAYSMIDRLRLSFWKAYFMACGVCGVVLMSALFASTIVDRVVGGS